MPIRLNEQFMRRLGADLHDGPAQLIGFALMSLDDLPVDKSAYSRQILLRTPKRRSAMRSRTPSATFATSLEG